MAWRIAKSAKISSLEGYRIDVRRRGLMASRIVDLEQNVFGRKCKNDS
jgi:hypothetical protein